MLAKGDITKSSRAMSLEDQVEEDEDEEREKQESKP
jgi:hypothetical protein